MLSQSVRVVGGPMVSVPTVTPKTGTYVTEPVSGPVPFHTVMFVYSGGGVGFPMYSLTDANLTGRASVWANFVPEINDQKTWSAFW